ncbi:unnamed protein product [Clonostachys chloroleuca]|uniref:Uncharacterized protein n=1 Tax=Clonostachys chloroleuca TaxID=1926264 RepID=A0AA35M0V5_9HYPO|nr:unnamed protein product [Clonostachys chloroleuca]
MDEFSTARPLATGNWIQKSRLRGASLTYKVRDGFRSQLAASTKEPLPAFSPSPELRFKLLFIPFAEFVLTLTVPSIAAVNRPFPRFNSFGPNSGVEMPDLIDSIENNEEKLI